jgi:anti-sigma factor RsiW
MKNANRPHCQSLLLELSAYLDGELSATRCRTIERHLAACPCCEELADQLRRAVSLCRQARQTRLPRDVRARAHARIEDLLAGSPAASLGARRATSGRTPARAATGRRRPKA